MTLETCRKLLAHFTKVGNKDMIKEFTERVARKEKRAGVSDAKKPKG